MSEQMTIALFNKIKNCVPFVTPEAGAQKTMDAMDWAADRIAQLERELVDAKNAHIRACDVADRATRRAEEAEQAEHKLDIEAERLAQENANLLSRAEEAECEARRIAMRRERQVRIESLRDAHDTLRKDAGL